LLSHAIAWGRPTATTSQHGCRRSQHACKVVLGMSGSFWRCGARKPHACWHR
jgi:hypothetical protein